jgi:hypothetical protein
MKQVSTNRIYAIEFREKGETEVKTFLCIGKDEEDAFKKFEVYTKDEVMWDVDKRTIKWGGSSIPLCFADGTVLYQQLQA